MDFNQIIEWIKINYVQVSTTILLILNSLQPFLNIFKNRDYKLNLNNAVDKGIKTAKVVSDFLSEVKVEFNKLQVEVNNKTDKLLEENKDLKEENKVIINAFITLLTVANIPLESKKEFYGNLSNIKQNNLEESLKVLKTETEREEKERVVLNTEINDKLKSIKKLDV